MVGTSGTPDGGAAEAVAAAAAPPGRSDLTDLSPPPARAQRAGRPGDARSGLWSGCRLLTLAVLLPRRCTAPPRRATRKHAQGCGSGIDAHGPPRRAACGAEEGLEQRCAPMAEGVRLSVLRVEKIALFLASFCRGTIMACSCMGFCAHVRDRRRRHRQQVALARRDLWRCQVGGPGGNRVAGQRCFLIMRSECLPPLAEASVEGSAKGASP